MERNQMKAMKWIEFDDGVKFNHLIGMGYSGCYVSLHSIITLYFNKATINSIDCGNEVEKEQSIEN